MKDRIKAVRKHYRLNQTDFGARLGVKQTTVAGWESSSRTPLEPIISLICREFDVNEQWLRTGEGEMFRPKDRDAELAYWVGTVMADEPESFRRRFLNLLVNLPPEAWDAMEHYAHILLGAQANRSEAPAPADPCTDPSKTD